MTALLIAAVLVLATLGSLAAMWVNEQRKREGWK